MKYKKLLITGGLIGVAAIAGALELKDGSLSGLVQQTRIGGFIGQGQKLDETAGLGRAPTRREPRMGPRRVSAPPSRSGSGESCSLDVERYLQSGSLSLDEKQGLRNLQEVVQTASQELVETYDQRIREVFPEDASRVGINFLFDQNVGNLLGYRNLEGKLVKVGRNFINSINGPLMMNGRKDAYIRPESMGLITVPTLNDWNELSSYLQSSGCTSRDPREITVYVLSQRDEDNRSKGSDGVDRGFVVRPRNDIPLNELVPFMRHMVIYGGEALEVALAESEGLGRAILYFDELNDSLERSLMYAMREEFFHLSGIENPPGEDVSDPSSYALLLARVGPRTANSVADSIIYRNSFATSGRERRE